MHMSNHSRRGQAFVDKSFPYKIETKNSIMKQLRSKDGSQRSAAALTTLMFDCRHN